MKVIAVILFLLGIYMIGLGYMQQRGAQCKNKIEYRFIPRSVYDEMLFRSPLRIL